MGSLEKGEFCIKNSTNFRGIYALFPDAEKPMCANFCKYSAEFPQNGPQENPFANDPDPISELLRLKEIFVRNFEAGNQQCSDRVRRASKVNNQSLVW